MYKRYHFKDNDRYTLHHRGELPRGSPLSLRITIDSIKFLRSSLRGH